MKAQAALAGAVQRLNAAGVPDPARDARHLLAHAMQIAADRLTLHLHDELPAEVVARLNDALRAREQRQPVSQITGQRLFWGQVFRVTGAVLDPRPETEILVAAALSQPFARLLDLGTGSGCILLSCLADRPMASGVGVDLSPAALRVARFNADALGLTGRAAFLISDWFTSVDGQFDLIVCNPPYIAADEMPRLSPEVLNWEPHAALTPGGDGLAAYRAIAAGAAARLLPGGRLLLEIGPTQGAAVTDLLQRAGLTGVHTLPDLDRRDRVVVATKPSA